VLLLGITFVANGLAVLFDIVPNVRKSPETLPILPLKINK
jgi:hypothetical protein